MGVVSDLKQKRGIPIEKNTVARSFDDGLKNELLEVKEQLTKDMLHLESLQGKSPSYMRAEDYMDLMASFIAMVEDFVAYIDLK